MAGKGAEEHRSHGRVKSVDPISSGKVYPRMSVRAAGDSYEWEFNSFAELGMRGHVSIEAIGEQIGRHERCNHGRSYLLGCGALVVGTDPDAGAKAPGFSQMEEKKVSGLDGKDMVVLQPKAKCAASLELLRWRCADFSE